MPDADMAALLQVVLDHVCAELPPSETAVRSRVAARLREIAQADGCSIEDLKRADCDELSRVPTMWR